MTKKKNNGRGLLDRLEGKAAYPSPPFIETAWSWSSRRDRIESGGETESKYTYVEGHLIRAGFVHDGDHGDDDDVVPYFIV